MNLELKKIKRTVYIIVVVLALASAALVWLLTRSYQTFIVSPRTASFYLDGKQLKVIAGEVKINTSIGNHLVSAQADGHTGHNNTYDFKRGLNKEIEISLVQTPEPVSISADASQLARGNGFNDGYYLGSNKVIYRLKAGLDRDGNISILENRAITPDRIEDTKEIVWSPTKELALLRHSKSVSLFDFQKYDFVNQTDTPWGGNDINSIAWAPDSSKIAYVYTPSTGERSLIFSNITNTQIERVLNLGTVDIEDPILRWSPDSQWILIIPRNTNADENKIYLFSAYTRSLQAITDSGNQIDALFSPDSNKILYETKKDGLSELYLMSKLGDNKTGLGIQAKLETTIWTKDSREIVVGESSEGYGHVFKFNTETLLPSGFEISDLADTAFKSISLSDDGKILFFESSNKISAIKIE